MNKTLQVVTVNKIKYLIGSTPEKNYKGYYYLNDKIYNTSKTMLQSGCKELVAIEYSTKVEGLHQFKLEDEFSQIESPHLRKYLRKANKALYTEEEVKKLAEQCYNEGAADSNEHENSTKNFNSFYQRKTQSLNKYKEIESVEVEMETFYDEAVSDGEQSSWDEYKLDEDGLLIITKINYKNGKAE